MSGGPIGADPAGIPSRSGPPWAPFALLFVIVAIFNRHDASVVPSGNELIFLPALLRSWDPSYLARDWTFAAPAPDRALFNLVFGPLTGFLPLEVVGWIGRALGWSLVIAALLRLGRHFGLPPAWMACPVAAWVLARQSFVAGEWVLGTFEAKTFGYGLLLFGLCALLERREWRGAALIGLAGNLHAVVGFWGALAAAVALLTRRHRPGTILGYWALMLLCAVPWLLPFARFGGAGARSAEGWQFVELVVMPYHFDPLSFRPRNVLLLAALFLFSVLMLRNRPRDDAQRLLTAFEAVLVLAFALGVAARLMEAWSVLRLMPMRLFPVFTFLFFLCRVTALVRDLRSPRLLGGGVALVLAAVLTARAPLARLVEDLRVQHAQWTAPDDDGRRAFRWIARHTPRDSLVILPPQRGDAYYFAARAQIANWSLVRLDRPGEWRRRVETLVGDTWAGPTAPDAMRAALGRRFTARTQAEIDAIARTYGADYLVTRAAYGYPVLFAAGAYRVYGLRGAQGGG